MSQEPMNVRRVTRVALRHKRLVGGLLIAGIIAGAGYSLARPATLTSSAVVVVNQPGLQSSGTSSGGLVIGVQTDILIAESPAVINGALARLGRGLSMKELLSDVSVSSAAPGAFSFTAAAATAEQAENEANAVADSFASYIGSPNSPIGRVQAHVLTPASSATSTDRVLHAMIYGLIGAVLGLIAGLVGALRLDRRDPRLRERDEIASSIGVPVIAALPADAPSDARGWASIFEEYEPPTAVHAWRLRAMLGQLGVVPNGTSGKDGNSLRVLSLASDPDALALGPQIAASAAATGVRTAFVVDAPYQADSTAALRTACGMPRGAVRGGNLLLSCADSNAIGEGGITVRGAQLIIVTTVVDPRSEQLPRLRRTSAAVLGVSAGVVSGEQLARAAAIAADSGVMLAGIVLLNPDPEDKTTGLVPHPVRLSRGTLPTKHENAREVRLGDRTRPTAWAAHRSR